VPLRRIVDGPKSASVFVFVDELEKALAGPGHGYIWA
jgi:hypothetical protein